MSGVLTVSCGNIPKSIHACVCGCVSRLMKQKDVGTGQRRNRFNYTCSCHCCAGSWTASEPSTSRYIIPQDGMIHLKQAGATDIYYTYYNNAFVEPCSVISNYIVIGILQSVNSYFMILKKKMVLLYIYKPDQNSYMLQYVLQYPRKECFR